PMPAHMGRTGPPAASFSAVIAMVTAFVTAPLIAWATKGRYYSARAAAPSEQGAHARLRTQRCVICEREYEGPDMAHCPAYQGSICSLFCTLDARCGDLCKPAASLSAQWSATLRWTLPRRIWPYLDTSLGPFLLLMLVVAPLLAALMCLLYLQDMKSAAFQPWSATMTAAALRPTFLRAYMALLVVAGIVPWWLVLAHKSRQVVQ